MRQSGASALWFTCCLGALAALVMAQVLLAERFFPGATLASAPVLTATWLQVAAGLIFGATLITLRRASGLGWLAAVLCTGLLMRLAFLSANPILETDFNRYLWDGAVVHAGANPWREAPQSAINGSVEAPLNTLAVEAGIVLSRVNHPELTTIYPPGAQLFFGISAALGRFDLNVWRVLLLVCELATLLILLRTLTLLDLPRVWIACWWINPLLAREAANTAHMDALLLPWLAAALYFLSINRNRLAFVPVAVATAIKLWPALLCAWVLQVNGRTRWLATGTVGALLVAIVIAPMLLTDRGSGSGLVAYSARWDTNGGVFSALRDLVSALGAQTHAQILARAIVVSAFCAWVLKTVHGATTTALDTFGQMYSVLMALLILSPAGYPWYALWLAPVAVLVPRWSFVAVTVALPLYYLRFYFEHRGEPWVFDHVIPVFEAGVILFVLWLEHTGRAGSPLRQSGTPG